MIDKDRHWVFSWLIAPYLVRIPPLWLFNFVTCNLCCIGTINTFYPFDNLKVFILVQDDYYAQVLGLFGCFYIYHSSFSVLSPANHHLFVLFFIYNKAVTVPILYYYLICHCRVHSCLQHSFCVIYSVLIWSGKKRMGYKTWWDTSRYYLWSRF